MNLPGFVAVKQLASEAAAAVLVSLFESRGISATMNEDDAGDMIPSLEMTRGVQVLVAEADATRAREILREFDAAHGEA